MKRSFYSLVIFLALAAAGCTLPGSAAAPTATEFVLPTVTETTAPTDTPEPTATEAPTETPEPSATPGDPTETPTNTPTATPLPIDPETLFGNPDLVDEMENDGNWAGANGGLPNTPNLLLAIGGGQLHVTAKQPNFDTWWFTWPAAGDQYIEMEVDTDSCTGKQAYGLILRGPVDAADAHGYVVLFSCDGHYSLSRLDNSDPYVLEELILWTESQNINAGSEETNTLGVHLQGSTISIYANNQLLVEHEDDTYSAGRFGLFTNGGTPGNFLWHIERLRWWSLD